MFCLLSAGMLTFIDSPLASRGITFDGSKVSFPWHGLDCPNLQRQQHHQKPMLGIGWSSRNGDSVHGQIKISHGRRQHKARVQTPAALRKLSEMRLRRGWPRSRKPPLSNPGSSFSSDRLSLSNFLPPPFIFPGNKLRFLNGISVPDYLLIQCRISEQVENTQERRAEGVTMY